jgi:hypothetical protein
MFNDKNPIRNLQVLKGLVNLNGQKSEKCMKFR